MVLYIGKKNRWDYWIKWYKLHKEKNPDEITGSNGLVYKEKKCHDSDCSASAIVT